MVKAKQKFHYLPDGTLDIPLWLASIQNKHALSQVTQLQNACEMTQKLTQGLTTFYGQPRLEHGLDVAEVILDLKLDQETAAAGIISSALSLTPQVIEQIKKAMGDEIASLMLSVQQMDIIPAIQKQQQTRNQLQVDKIRKMLLGMAKDIRAVIIKLADRLSFMRGIKAIAPEERKQFAQEVLDIYAPLANRLGIGQVKWELEDLAFHYLDPVTYKTIASFLAERRIDRENRINEIIHRLQDKLQAAHIRADVNGRAKHIYSIYLKAQRKHVDYQDIYDQSAVRILVPTIQDCYEALSIVHSSWPPIMEEFDDYIAHPKPNGYRSIHTAVLGENGKHFEIQIRTYTMHEEAERGVAAHWLYKENKANPLDDSTKISYLRQLLDWHKEIAQSDQIADVAQATHTDDRVYVITPAGDILDLPHGATPLDFAYHIHSELGHRCRGAKINGQIVPLTYSLHTGDKVEIITVLQGNPSRDWLNPELNYVKTSRARSKISHWFKQQALNEDIASGRQVFERELARHGLAKTTSLSTIARYFNLKDENALLASLGRGNVRIGQIMQLIQPKEHEKAAPTSMAATLVKPVRESSNAIAGAADLLTRFAKCCKPIPGDAIIGYITHGRGISIHKKTCQNAKQLSDPRRFIHIDWDKQKIGVFSTDLKIVSQDQDDILSDLTSLFANEKISLLSFHSTFNKNQNKIFIQVTVQVQDLQQLHNLLNRIQQLPGVIEVTRMK